MLPTEMASDFRPNCDCRDLGMIFGVVTELLKTLERPL